MANPAITGSMTLREWQFVVPLSTTTTENILANAAASGKVIEITSLMIVSDDSGNSATIDFFLYDQDGTGMNDETGPYQAAIGADVVAGGVIGKVGPESLEVAASGGQILFDKLNTLTLLEDQSLVAQASAVDDLVVTCRYTVKG